MMNRIVKNIPIIATIIFSAGVIAFYIKTNGSTVDKSLVWSKNEVNASSLPKGVDAPEFRLIDTQGNALDWNSLQSKRVAIAFITQWCDYCGQLQENLVEFREPTDTELIIVCNGTREDAINVKNKYTHRFRILVDEGGDIAQLYKVDGVPKVYIIDREGKIESSVSGMPNTWDLIQTLNTN